MTTKRPWYVIAGWWNNAAGYCCVVTRNPHYGIANRWLIFGPFFTEYRARLVAHKFNPTVMTNIQIWAHFALMWEHGQPCWMSPRCICNGEKSFLCPVYHSQTQFTLECNNL